MQDYIEILSNALNKLVSSTAHGPLPSTRIPDCCAVPHTVGKASWKVEKGGHPGQSIGCSQSSARLEYVRESFLFWSLLHYGFCRSLIVFFSFCVFHLFSLSFMCIFDLPVSVTICQSFCLSVYVCMSICLPAYLPVSCAVVCLSHCISMCLVGLCFSLSLSLSFSFPLPHSFHLSLSLSLVQRERERERD